MMNSRKYGPNASAGLKPREAGEESVERTGKKAKLAAERVSG
jgi:hypothetical protein